MNLGALQQEFTYMVARLVYWVYQNRPSYKLTYGEAFRTPEQCVLNAAKGSGISNSLHSRRLAVDLNLFIDGVYQEDSIAYEPLGRYWESIGGSWGGRFTKPDGNHFSFSPDGGKTR